MATAVANAPTGGKAAAPVASRRDAEGVFRDVDGQVDWKHQEVDIEREGRRITLPAEPGPMPIDDAVAALLRLKKDEETLLDVREIIDCFPLEGAVAFNEAMRQIYGWASPTPKMGFFGPSNPDYISVQSDIDVWHQVPWGEFKIPNIENNVGLAAGRDDGKTQLIIYSSVRKRERGFLLELAALTRKLLRDHSIYRGKALHLRTDSEGKLAMERPPVFLDVRDANAADLILNRSVEQQVNTNIYALIEHTAKVKAAKIPLKRGVLLAGKYGVGKTMLTRIVAQKCIGNAWTFIMVDKSTDLKEALLFAKRYQPAVVFCEDIDRAMSERNDAANELLNTIDGIISKDTEIMVVLTTNHVENIEPAMLRPGRLDAVISVLPPDAEAVQRLIKLYSRSLLAEGETLDRVGETLAGNIPAVVREVVERSKLSMIANDHEQMTEEDLLISAGGMQGHLALLDRTKDEPTAGERLALALQEIVGSSGGGGGVDPKILDQAIAKDGNATRRLVKDGASKNAEAILQAGGAITGVRQKLDKTAGIVDAVAKEVGAG